MAFNYGADPFEVGEVTWQFNSGLELLLQQTESVFRGLVNVGTYVGKGARIVNQVGVVEWTQPQARFSDLVPQIAQFTNRWVFPNDRNLSLLVDQFDELRSLVDPKGGLTEAAAAGANRYFDDLIINAATATATTGPDSANFATEPFATTASTSGGYLVADTFGASASTGMTWPKIVEIERVMRHAQVRIDQEGGCLAIGSQQNADLSKQQEVISREYGGMMVVNGGAIERVGKFRLVHSERLGTSSSNSLRNCIAWVPSGLHLGLWKDRQIYIDNIVTKTGRPWQLYGMLTAGATRTQLFKIVQINAADTTGADPTAP